MPDCKVSPGPLRGNPAPKEAVCIHTKKVYDSCRDKECIQDLKVSLTRESQALVDAAVSVKAKTAELLWTYIDVEEISFNKGFYTVDVTYFYRIVCEVYLGVGKPREISGLARYEKRTVLFGSEGGARIFSSQFTPNATDIQFFERTNLPIAVVEVVDPVILAARVAEVDSSNSDCGCNCCCCCCCEIPQCISGCFDDELVLGDSTDTTKNLYVTLGQFSIIKLERDIQLLMPAYDICMPEKECAGTGGSEDPCQLFEQFSFPVEEFFPPRMETDNYTNGCCNNNGSNCSNGNNCTCTVRSNSRNNCRR